MDYCQILGLNLARVSIIKAPAPFTCPGMEDAVHSPQTTDDFLVDFSPKRKTSLRSECCQVSFSLELLSYFRFTERCFKPDRILCYNYNLSRVSFLVHPANCLIICKCFNLTECKCKTILSSVTHTWKMQSAASPLNSIIASLFPAWFLCFLMFI